MLKLPGHILFLFLALIVVMMVHWSFLILVTYISITTLMYFVYGYH